ncbi:hypothetical protein [Shewanella woodyi]|uniref:hypothetical protein n=1 Tax=Shewanella woodyi TaxID=60961 RepID=UPI0037487F5C
MNPYLTSLLDAISIDIDHLKNEYLSDNELTYLNEILKSEQDFELDFYTAEHGNNLECLLMFLSAHKRVIIDLMQGKGNNETLIHLYTSSIVSGSYGCFRFNLSKFRQTFVPSNEVITVYRIGRDTENQGNLGCSWATSIDGLKAYCDASSLSKSMLNFRPIFVATVDDSQVLFEGNKTEQELVLKPDFKYHMLDYLDEQLRINIGR